MLKPMLGSGERLKRMQQLRLKRAAEMRWCRGLQLTPAHGAAVKVSMKHRVQQPLALLWLLLLLTRALRLPPLRLW